MEEKMTIPTEGMFALAKVKRLKNGGLDVHYEVTETVGVETYTNKYHVECGKDIHPDLRILFDRLAPIMGRIYNLTSFKSMMEAPEFEATALQIDMAEAFGDECLENIRVMGISLSGQNDNVGVVLSGLYTVGSGQSVGMSSPRIKFSAEVFGFEEELEEVVAEIEREVYAYLFRGKKAQLELFGADGDITDSGAGREE